MPEVKEYQPTVIEATQFPGIEQQSLDAPGSAAPGRDNYAPTEVPGRTFPTQTIANTVISDSFDTQSRRILAEYEFAKQGALQIGEYVEGESGDVRISPSGIIGRNLDGDITFSLDAVTGDATFRGTVAAGSLIAGRTDIGIANGNVWIDGDEVRIMISDGTHDRILLGRQVGGF